MYYNNIIAATEKERSTEGEKHVTAHFDELLLENMASVYMLRVNTNVMADAGIHMGDVIAVDCKANPVNNSIVVAVIDYEMVIRKLERNGARDVLTTPGRKLASLDVTGRLNVWGVVKYVIREV
jgi:DNA polymerase V